MENLVKSLENENGNVEQYLDKFSALSDEEIVTLFSKVNISDSKKETLLILANERKSISYLHPVLLKFLLGHKMSIFLKKYILNE